jgi:hypothetical protein
VVVRPGIHDGADELMPEDGRADVAAAGVDDSE